MIELIGILIFALLVAFTAIQFTIGLVKFLYEIAPTVVILVLIATGLFWLEGKNATTNTQSAQTQSAGSGSGN